uniref:Uncharacterized protein n=1 Tax=Chromera velia CCMP2878 TaxID=1169474 RepID=A0A0G4IE98_9ALVE|eukprot:Cvel_2377.t1-p1 / transcript=Cvel_2377.t1 / gene=Cvel_2377 / organism=Chromera_velia_CCMP2878 / gene_product=hypothetical protein / transcript_product=hypothetical protein / location=Cvel_scaffold92:53684-57284(+) / protein_length=552 / sequence_SO=supercontig / SO=protein_coding / is_pseudo=false
MKGLLVTPLQALSEPFLLVTPLQALSELACNKEGYGLAWVLLEFMKQGRCQLHFESLDLSDEWKEGSLLAFFSPRLELYCSSSYVCPHVCKNTCLPVLLDLLLRLKAALEEGGPSMGLKTLNLASNRLHCPSMEVLGSLLSSCSLPSLLSLDLSDNPLGPSGVKALVKGLSSSADPPPLQTLKLARTKAKAEGMEALVVTLKAKKTTSLQTLDLAKNEMRPAGVKHLASAVNAEAVPHLQVLSLSQNELIMESSYESNYALMADLLSINALKELEEFDLSENYLFDQRLGDGGEDSGVELSAAAFVVTGRFPRLRWLDIGGDPPIVIDPTQLKAFAAALALGGLPSLQELALLFGATGGSAENPKDAEGVVALANALTSGHLSNLKAFKVSLPPGRTREAFVLFSHSLTTGKASLLKTLDLDVWGESSSLRDGVEALAENIRGGGLCSLESLRLWLLQIEGVALSSLGMSFGSGGCPSLQKLDLSWKEAGDEGVGGLVEGLGGGRLSFLRDLSLKVHCLDGSEGGWMGEGCIALGEVLSTNKVPSLRVVTLK